MKDYTEWQQNLFDNMTPEQINDAARQYCQQHPYKGNAKVLDSNPNSKIQAFQRLEKIVDSYTMIEDPDRELAEARDEKYGMERHPMK